MAGINPSVLNNNVYTSSSGKRCYTRLTILSITQTSGAENKTTINWKLTVEGTRYVYLHGIYSTLGGVLLYQDLSNDVATDWHAGDIIASGSKTFDNNNDGSLVLSAYIKQLFNYTYSSSRWANSSTTQSNSVDMTCTVIPRFPQLSFSSVTTQLNKVTIGVSNTLNIGVNEYEVRRVSDNGYVTGGNANGATSFNFDITGLGTNTNYSGVYKVRGYFNGGWGEYLTLTNANIKTTALPVVVATSGSVDSNSTIQFNNLNYISSWSIVAKAKIDNAVIKSLNSITTNNYLFGLTSDEKNSLLSKYPTSNNPSLYLEISVVSNGITYRVYTNVSTNAEINYVIPDTSNYQPTFTDANVINIQELDYQAITGSSSKFIKNHNRLQGTITPMTLKYGATGNGYSITCGSKSTSKGYLSSNQNFELNDIEANSLIVVASDKRNKTSTANKQLTLIDYVNPKVYQPFLVRQNGIDEYAILSADGTFTAWTGLAVENTILTVEYRYKLSTDADTSYSNWVSIPLTNVTIDAVNGHWEVLNLLLAETFNNTQRYDFQVKISDKLETIISEVGQLSTANVFLWKDLSADKLGIGKKPGFGVRLDIGGNQNIDYDLTVGERFYNPQGGSNIDFWRTGTGYTTVCTITCTTARPNQPMSFEVLQRGRKGKVNLLFSESGSIGILTPDVITVEGNIVAYYKITLDENQRSIFTLYLQRNGSNDGISIQNFQKGDTMSSTYVTWIGTIISTLPSGYVTINNLVTIAGDETVRGALNIQNGAITETIISDNNSNYTNHITNASNGNYFNKPIRINGNLTLDDGWLFATTWGKTIQIGSLNIYACHYVTSADVHWFNKSMQVNGNIFLGVNGSCTEIVRGETILFEGEALNDITLNDSVANYTYVEIYFTVNNYHTSTKVCSPNGKRVCLVAVDLDVSTTNTGYVNTTKIVTLSGNVLSVTSNARMYFYKNSSKPTVDNINAVVITKVVGYR